MQARGHVVHLREGYIETGGDHRAVAKLVAAAIPPFRALVKNVARLDGISPKALVTQLDLDNFEKGFREALRAAERIVDYVDTMETLMTLQGLGIRDWVGNARMCSACLLLLLVAPDPRRGSGPSHQS